MKRLFVLILAAVMMLAFAACGDSASAESASNGLQADDAVQTEQTEGSNMLVAYFSLAGEQYGVGVVEEGNTSIIAHMIAEQTGADLFEIKPETLYPTTYQELLDVSQQEMADNARPEIVGTVDAYGVSVCEHFVYAHRIWFLADVCRAYLQNYFKNILT